MKISAFTFAYNALESGMPIIEAIASVRTYADEVIAVDCQSTDDTKRILSLTCDKVIAGPRWEGRDIQHQVFELHKEYCRSDIIILFEADEVYDESLLGEVLWAIEMGHRDIGVHRIQIEQNFQRVRSYPEPCYRIFPKGGGYYHKHPTHCPDNVYVLPPSAGYLWDCSNNFPDNWQQRKVNQSQVWGEPVTLSVAKHFAESNIASPDFNEPHFSFTDTPLKIPAILKPLLGKRRYEVKL